MKVGEMIREALEKNGFSNLMDASKAIGISPELIRIIINKGHIPKDKTLMLIAEKLDLDQTVLILAAHMAKVPAEAKGFFLLPNHSKQKEGKRISPLSEEQCNYLEKIMEPEEIEMLRKFRQVTEEAQIQITGYIHYIFVTHRTGLVGKKNDPVLSSSNFWNRIPVWAGQN